MVHVSSYVIGQFLIYDSIKRFFGIPVAGEEPCMSVCLLYISCMYVCVMCSEFLTFLWLVRSRVRLYVCDVYLHMHVCMYASCVAIS